MNYVRIVSWHSVRTFTRAGGVITRCGRFVPPPVTESPFLPMDEKSCESCLRLTLRDAQVVANDEIGEPVANDEVSE